MSKSGRSEKQHKRSIFQPEGDDTSGDVDVDLAKLPCAGIEKLMRHIGGRDDDLSGMGDQRFVAHREGAFPILDDENFLVGMGMQAHGFAGSHIGPR